MSYHEIRSIVNIVTTVALNALYTWYRFQSYPQSDPYSIEVFRFWGSFFLILIPVAIAARILIHIFFAIFTAVGSAAGAMEEVPAIEDERDKLIEMKASLRSLYVFALGFVVAMAAIAFDQPPVVMFIILFVGGMASELFSEVSHFLFYRRGV